MTSLICNVMNIFHTKMQRPRASHYQKCGTFAVRDRKPAVSFINDDSAKKRKQYGCSFFILLQNHPQRYEKLDLY